MEHLIIIIDRKDKIELNNLFQYSVPILLIWSIQLGNYQSVCEELEYLTLGYISCNEDLLC